MNKHNQEVCAKMIIGAETGGQVYGAGRWDDVKIPKIGLEKTLTLGAYQFYGNEGRTLLRMIYEVDQTGFIQEITDALSINWFESKWVPGPSTRECIARIISSETGVAKQIELFCEIQLPAYVTLAELYGVTEDPAQMMWVEIEHVGGLSAARRIFARCDGNHSLDKIMWSLKQDQYDHSSENQAGDNLYWSRHVFCKACIDKYADFGRTEFDYVIVKVGD